MTVQYIVNLAGTDWVVYCLLVCCLNFADFHKLTFLGPRLKKCKRRNFFFNVQITVITAIMISGNGFKSFVPVFCHQSGYICGMETCGLCDLIGFHALCTQFQCFQSCVRAFVFIVSVLDAFIAAISSLLNLYFDAIFITQIHYSISVAIFKCFY